MRKENPYDKRSANLYATGKAEKLKNSKAYLEGLYYEWLLDKLPEEECSAFVETLDKLYLLSKTESRAGFPNLRRIVEGKAE